MDVIEDNLRELIPLREQVSRMYKPILSVNDKVYDFDIKDCAGYDYESGELERLDIQRYQGWGVGFNTKEENERCRTLIKENIHYLDQVMTKDYHSNHIADFLKLKYGRGYSFDNYFSFPFTIHRFGYIYRDRSVGFMRTLTLAVISYVLYKIIL